MASKMKKKKLTTKQKSLPPFIKNKILKKKPAKKGKK